MRVAFYRYHDAEGNTTSVFSRDSELPADQMKRVIERQNEWKKEDEEIDGVSLTEEFLFEIERETFEEVLIERDRLLGWLERGR